MLDAFYPSAPDPSHAVSTVDSANQSVRSSITLQQKVSHVVDNIHSLGLAIRKRCVYFIRSNLTGAVFSPLPLPWLLERVKELNAISFLLKSITQYPP